VIVSAESDAVLRQIEALEGRFRSEQERHAANLAEMRNELNQLVQRGDDLGISVTAMSKAMKISRGRLNRMLQELR